MQSKRTIFLTGVLIVLSLGYVGQVTWENHVKPWMYPHPDSKPLPGENNLSNIVVSRSEAGEWFVDFDYFYTGEPRFVNMAIEVLDGAPSKPRVVSKSPEQGSRLVQRGQHHITQELIRPPIAEAVSASQVRIRFFQMRPQPTDFLNQSVSIALNWPDLATAHILSELHSRSADDFLQRTRILINSEEKKNLLSARQRLQLFLEKYPQRHQAYIELARVAMDTNWGPEGWRQAELYVDTARTIAPDDPDVWLMHAFVYLHQKRYKEAEQLFVAASKTDTPNLWLWTHWGYFYLRQGKTPQAIDMFQKAVDQPPSHTMYDRARHPAYRELIRLLDQKNQLDRIQTLYEKRYADYGSVACYGVELAQFMLMKQGQAARAAELASQTSIATCEQPNPKEILGLAHYVSWVEAPAAEQAELLNRARIAFPSSTRLVYQLASSDHTAKALKALQSAGEPIDQMDNRKMTALAYALSNKDHDTARRLLRLQARSNLVIGPSEIPLSLIPVLAEDYPGIRLLRQSGVDYTKIKYQNMTAIDHAKSIGNRKLLEALGGHQGQRL